MNLATVRRLALYEAERLVRARYGVVMLLGLLGWHVLTATRLRAFTGEVSAATDALADPGARPFYEVVSWWTELDADTIRAMLTGHPPLLVAYFVIAVGVTPLFAMLLSFDQHASDIRSRHVRFLLMRADRTSLLLGKALGTAGVAALGSALAVAVGGGILAAGGAVPGPAELAYLGRVALTTAAYTVPFVALMALTGVVLARPFAAALAGFALQLLVWIAASLGGLWQEPLRNLRYGFPSATKYLLVSDRAADLGTAALHQGVSAAVFFGLALLVLRRRDL